MAIKLVLFDLDGTLADTAPDMCLALNRLRRNRGLNALPHHLLRAYVSHGSNALIQAAFNISSEHPDFGPLRKAFLDDYLQNIAVATQVFPGMNALLLDLAAQGLSWGIVTNKPGWLTRPLMQQIAIAVPPRCVVSGGDIPRAKPHPDGILRACELAGIAPAQTLYVGDAERDIEAAHRANMPCLLALFGYIHPDDRPHEWQADGIIEHPAEILAWLKANAD
jgi:N-acetyl-D-muramate 6-phosphate phosphatase